MRFLDRRSGSSNHLDKYLLGRFFREDAAGPVLVVFTGLAGIIVAITIVLFGQAVFTHAPRQVFFVMGAGAFLVASYIPYMIAMQRDEASIVASLYRLAPVFVFVLSYVVLGETLRLKQIVGAVVTILGSILLICRSPPKLAQDRSHHIRPDVRRVPDERVHGDHLQVCRTRSILLEFGFLEYIGSGIFSVTLIFSMPSYRRALFALLRSREACTLVPITVSGEALNLLANLAVGFAGLMAPLALVSIVTGLHPFFVLGYGMLFTRFLPAFGRERNSSRHCPEDRRDQCDVCRDRRDLRRMTRHGWCRVLHETGKRHWRNSEPSQWNDRGSLRRYAARGGGGSLYCLQPTAFPHRNLLLPSSYFIDVAQQVRRVLVNAVCAGTFQFLLAVTAGHQSDANRARPPCRQ